jgi:hypothetical protein
LPGNSRALKVAYQARLAWPEGGADLYRHSIALWQRQNPPGWDCLRPWSR